MGLIDERMSNSDMTRKLFDAGIVTVPASHNPHAVIVRPVLVLREAEAETIIKTVRNALG
jgi:acetylornithine/succinyldiaminopimelate/putrescine aminotransferase